MNIFEILRLRTEYEDIITKYKYKLPSYESSINNLEWFINNARKHNGLRNDFERAMNIAEQIVEESYGQNRFKQGRRNN